MVLIKGLRKNFSLSASVRYSTKEFDHKTYSLLAYGRCNFRCKFCFSFGSDADENGVLPDAKKVQVSELENFVLEETKAGKAIRFSGGEPTLYTDLTIHLIRLIKKFGGLTIVDTNGSLPDKVKEISNYTDVLSIDSLKSNVENVEEITGADKQFSWNNPIKTIKLSEEFPCLVEYKTIIFHPVEYDFIEFIYSLLPKNVLWTLKQYLTSRSLFPESPNDEIIRKNQNNGLRQPTRNELIKLASYMIDKHADLKGRFSITIGSARNPKNHMRY
jgi:pyruvate-formate lyase-activating enzyme